jgi:hypothetical protein
MWYTGYKSEAMILLRGRLLISYMWYIPVVINRLTGIHSIILSCRVEEGGCKSYKQSTNIICEWGGMVLNNVEGTKKSSELNGIRKCCQIIPVAYEVLAEDRLEVLTNCWVVSWPRYPPTMRWDGWNRHIILTSSSLSFLSCRSKCLLTTGFSRANSTISARSKSYSNRESISRGNWIIKYLYQTFGLNRRIMFENPPDRRIDREVQCLWT